MNTEAQKVILKKLETEGETAGLDLDAVISIIDEAGSFEEAVDRLKLLKKEKQSKVGVDIN